MASSDRPGLVRRPATLALAAVALTAALAGCGHSSKKPAVAAGLFDSQNQAKLTCMAHQTQHPGTLYTGGAAGADTAHILEMLQYYTANGAKPYCDGAKPTATDVQWAKLYVSLGGATAKVPSALGSG